VSGNCPSRPRKLVTALGDSRHKGTTGSSYFPSIFNFERIESSGTESPRASMTQNITANRTEHIENRRTPRGVFGLISSGSSSMSSLLLMNLFFSRGESHTPTYGRSVNQFRNCTLLSPVSTYSSNIGWSSRMMGDGFRHPTVGVRPRHHRFQNPKFHESVSLLLVRPSTQRVEIAGSWVRS
jgi:hypothetical protein